MSEPRLDGAGIVPLVGEGVAAGVAQHVRMRLEVEAGFRAGTLDHLGEAARRERRAAFAGEDEGRYGSLLAL
jgi:hypothetical protein